MGRAIVWGVIFVLTLTAAVFGWAWRTATAPLPQHDGAVTLEGLSAPVEILRDERGIAHIFAATRQDLLFAQGYVHAQDRWFTMDLYRRVARGELAGLVGADESAVENDRLMRALGFADLAARDYAALDDETRAAIDAFAAGVNAYIADRKPGRLALEYSVLSLGGLAPEIRPWTAQDALAVGKLMGFALSGRDATRELERATMRAALTTEMYAQWRPDYDYERHPTVIAAADLPVIAAASQSGASPAGVREGRAAPRAPTRYAGDALSKTFAFYERLGFAAEGAGSNSWAVSSAHTKSGKPMLAVDPHNGIELPNLWHEIGLNIRNGADPSNDISIYGFAAAPFFMILEGTNDYGAWGTTNVTGGDALDLYELTLNPENAGEYLWDGEWRPLEQETVSIDVAGGEAIPFTIERTHFGPLLPAVEGAPRYAVRWGGFDKSALARASLTLPFNRSFKDLRRALADWDYPPTHFLYVGQNGDIGMQQAGRFPIRAPGADGALPQDGSQSAARWRGFLAYEHMPYVKNPASGVIASGNNPAVPPRYFEAVKTLHDIDGEIDFLRDGARGYRGARIIERLKAGAPHDEASFSAIQIDATVPGLRASLQPILDATKDAPALCRETLDAWPGVFAAESAGALVFAYVWTAILDEVYAPHFPAGVSPKVGMTELLSLETILADPDSDWWDLPETPARESRDARLPALFASACDSVRSSHGSVPALWRWGDVHGAHFRNEILDGSGLGLLQAFGNRGPAATFGGAATVSIGRWRHGNGYNAVHIPGYRFIIDLGWPAQAMAINSTGQSSHPASRHYADQMEQWAMGAYDRRLFAEDAVRARAKHALILTPRQEP